MLFCFIAGPYGDGSGWENQFKNVMRADTAAREAAAKGWLPLNPVKLFSYWDRDKRFRREHFIKMDNQLLALCQALVRVPGESPGADAEVALAKRLGISVYFGIESLPSVAKLSGEDSD